MTVPFLDLSPGHAELREEIDAAIRRVIDSSQFILGSEVEAFEAEFAAAVGARHCIGVGNGLDALEIALRSHELAVGDEVIVPANTYIATWLAVTRAGGTPVPVEPDVRTYNLDPELVAAAVSPRTRGILAVHLYGQPADLTALGDMASRHGLWLIEDAAQAHGARISGRPIGGFGNTVGWSFYPSKNLGALGDGGAITTDDDEVADRARLLRNYGARTKYRHEAAGANSRLDEMQAAILRVKLPALAAWNERRRAAAAAYSSSLERAAVIVPWVPAWAEPVWHCYVVRSAHRDQLREHLERAGIGTLIHYPVPPHLEPPYADLGLPRGSLPHHGAASQTKC